MDPTMSMFNWPPLADVARAMGGRGVAVTSEADLDRAVAEIGSGDGPLLIELALDPAAVPRLHH
jgi:acetolactate synthase I/II/III large subunit